MFSEAKTRYEMYVAHSLGSISGLLQGLLTQLQPAAFSPDILQKTANLTAVLSNFHLQTVDNVHHQDLDDVTYTALTDTDLDKLLAYTHTALEIVQAIKQTPLPLNELALDIELLEQMCTAVKHLHEKWANERLFSNRFGVG